MTRIFHGIEVVKIAEEFIETMDRRQEFVQITEVVLAKLSCRIAHGFQDGRDRWRFGRYAKGRAGLTYSSQTRPDRELPSNEVRAPSRATCLGIIVGEPHAFRGQSVQVGRAAGHDALMVGTDVEPPDVIAHDKYDVGFGRLLLQRGRLCDNSPQNE